MDLSDSQAALLLGWYNSLPSLPTPALPICTPALQPHLAGLLAHLTRLLAHVTRLLANIARLQVCSAGQLTGWPRAAPPGQPLC